MTREPSAWKTYFVLTSFRFHQRFLALTLSNLRTANSSTRRLVDLILLKTTRSCKDKVFQENMPPRAHPEMTATNDEHDGHGMRRVSSESSMSEAGGPAQTREYRVRKSSLIGYVYALSCWRAEICITHPSFSFDS